MTNKGAEQGKYYFGFCQNTRLKGTKTRGPPFLGSGTLSRLGVKQTTRGDTEGKDPRAEPLTQAKRQFGR